LTSSAEMSGGAKPKAKKRSKNARAKAFC